MLIKDGLLEPWATELRKLAAFPNVLCKVSGMVTEADWQAWKPSDFAPYLDVVIEAFGVKRIMMGSDWPVCTVAAAYGQAICRRKSRRGRMARTTCSRWRHLIASKSKTSEVFLTSEA